MHVTLALHGIPEIVEPAGVLDIRQAAIGPGDGRQGAVTIRVVGGEFLADVEVHCPEDAFGVLIPGTGAKARAHVMERRHLVERTAGKLEADISRDRDIGVAAVDQCAGRWCGADNLDFPRFETDDAATATRCSAGASNDAEGH